jgi:hypothetical protein
MLIPFDAPDVVTLRSDQPLWGVVPSAFLTPELGFGVEGHLFGVYRFGENIDRVDPISFVSVSGFLTSTESYGFSSMNQIHLLDDRLRLLYEAQMTKLSTHYWGIGYDNGHDDRHRQTHDGIEFRTSPQVALKLAPNWWAIGGLDGVWLRSQSYQEKNKKQKVTLPNQRTISALLELQWDDRVVKYQPQKGTVFSIQWVGSRQVLGSDQNFDRWTMDIKQYYPLGRDDVIAWSVFAQALTGKAPWYALSQLGGETRMRGYYDGRYRDKTQLNGQVEWRHRFTQRHGMVIWGGVGAISPSVSSLSSAHWLPTVGVGYRFALKPRINVRLDFGLGQSTTGFYIKIKEAF